MDNQLNTIGKRIKFARKKAQMSQEALAKLVGVTRTAVGSWEKDASAPERRNLDALARALQTTEQWIMFGTGLGVTLKELGQQPEQSATTNIRHAIHFPAEKIASHKTVQTGKPVHEQGTSQSTGEVVYFPANAYAVQTGIYGHPASGQVVDAVAFNTDWIAGRLGVQPDSIAVIREMTALMAPTVNQDDLVVINLEAHFDEDGLYVIDTGQKLVTRRLQRMLNGTLLMICDNPTYRDEQIMVHDLRGSLIGRVIMVMKIEK